MNSPSTPSGLQAPGPLARHDNEVALTGRLAVGALERVLPSGDRCVSFRVIVARPANGRAAQRSRSRIDTIDCVAWSAQVRRQVLGWQADDLVHVTGALRRRFWRAPSGATASRYEVDVAQARRVQRATIAG
jgi:single-strand DNA-binding protein